MIELTIVVVAFLVGGALTALVLLRVGSGREGRGARLGAEAPTRAAAAARCLTGLYVHLPDVPPENDGTRRR